MVLYTRSEPPPAAIPARAQASLGWLTGCGFVLALALALIPIFTTETLPLLDWPNHMARMHVLLNHAHSAFLQRIYAVEWRPIPDLAMDFVVPALARLMPLDWAGRCFIALTFLLLAGGAALIHRMLFGRFSPWVLIGFLFLYDRALLLGFVNYLFGLGLALVGLALWLWLERRPALLRVALSSLLSVALYLSHLFAFGVYGLAVAGLVIGRLLAARGGSRRAALLAVPYAGIQALLPLALFFFAGMRDPDAPPAGFGRFARKADLLFSVFDNYERWFDVGCFAVLALLLLWAWRRGRIRFAPAMALPLLLLFAAYLAMPSSWMSANNIDRRLPIAIALLLVASSAPHQLSRRGAGLLAGGLAALFLTRMAIIESHWRAADRAYAPLLAALDEIPPGARFAVAYRTRTLNQPPNEAPIAHLATEAVGRRDAFVPTLFASPQQHPVVFTYDYRIWAVNSQPADLWRELVEHPGTMSRGHIAMLQSFHALLLIDPEPFTFPVPDWLEPITVTPRFKLYRVPGAPPPP